VAAEAGITVTDSVTGLFEVKNASLAGNDDIKLNFNFNNKENLASGVVVTSSLGMNLITEGIMLTELSTKVLEGESFYNR